MRGLFSLLVLVTLLYGAPSMAVGAAPPDQHFGLMLNEDGDLIFAAADPDPEVAVRNLKKTLDTLNGLPVGTLVYNIATGSDILHYPTRVGSIWGWRHTDEEKQGAWADRLAKMRPAASAGLDSVRAAADWCTENGVRFVPSYRINDAHYCNNPHSNPLTGRFWIENHERLRLGVSPLPEVETYKELLDFTHAEVRAHRLAIIAEAAERYADVMDGFQIDFTRHPILFPADKAQERAPLITDLMMQVRGKLAELGQQHGRHYALIVRVPPTLEHCGKAGLDIRAWIKKGLVDIIIPSQAMTLAHDMPVHEFAALAASHGIKVYGSLLNRSQFAWPFITSPSTETYSGAVGWEPSGALARGAIINFRAMGAAGVELYNYNLPLAPHAEETVVAGAAADPVAGERIYAVTPRYWLDHTDRYEPPKQLPARLRARRPVRLSMYVGENVSASGAAAPIHCALRLGFYTDGRAVETLGTLTVRVNGQLLFSGPAADLATVVLGKQNQSSKHVPPPVQAYIQIPINQLDVLKQGQNQVVLDVTPSDSQAKYNLCEVQLGVLPKQ